MPWSAFPTPVVGIGDARVETDELSNNWSRFPAFISGVSQSCLMRAQKSPVISVERNVYLSVIACWRRYILSQLNHEDPVDRKYH